jgi:hypothetical protein
MKRFLHWARSANPPFHHQLSTRCSQWHFAMVGGGIVVSCTLNHAAACAKWPVFNVQQQVRPAGIVAALR